MYNFNNKNGGKNRYMKNLLVFDLGGTSIKYALITKNGDILEKGITSTPKESFTSLCEVLESIYFNFKGQNVLWNSI